MKINHNAFGIALLSATFVGANAPAQAQNRKDAREEVREQRQNVKDKRQNVREADSNRERREAAQDLRAAQRNLQKDKSVLQNTRPNPSNRPIYRSGYAQNVARTLEGRVVNDTRGNDFTLRLSSGQIIRVVAVNGEARRISRGDRVRVYGIANGVNFRAQSVSILRNR